MLPHKFLGRLPGLELSGSVSQHWLLAALTLWCLHPLPVVGQASKFPPRDEALRQPDFFSFRAQLLMSLGRRDTTELLKVVAPDIRNTFGDDDGLSTFRQLWRLNVPDSELWGELAGVLALGGTFENESTFVAPYVFSRWPSRYDAFDYVAVIASDVWVRAEPSFTAPVLSSLGFEVVQRARTTPRPLTATEAAAWEPILLDNGGVGYMAKRFVRSPVEYRAVFVRRGRRWTMVSFIAGD